MLIAATLVGQGHWILDIVLRTFERRQQGTISTKVRPQPARLFQMRFLFYFYFLCFISFFPEHIFLAMAAISAKLSDGHVKKGNHSIIPAKYGLNLRSGFERRIINYEV